MINALSAANAYREQLKMQEGIKNAGQDEVDEASFSSLLKEAAQEAIDTQYGTEAIKMESLTGKVELTDLVTAVSAAELSLNTVVAVRDKVISAYQEIIRMPI
ncbi:MAG: flagellar hook-basal body complex protein FliE [Rickettsiales bacterium]